MTREVHHYKVLDSATGEWVIPPFKCTAERIAELNGQIIDGTMSVVSRASLDKEGCYDPGTARDAKRQA
jgi:hypothetical protein